MASPTARACALALFVGIAAAQGGSAGAECMGEPSVWDANSASRGSSLSCLSCHDGTVAASVSHGRDTSEGVGESHPVQISYARASFRAGSTLRPASLLDARLRLPEGNVECITCHDLANKAGAHLAMPNGESSMCTQCHSL